MRRSVLVLVLVAATASTASAGIYAGLGIGTGAETDGDTYLEKDGRSGRLMLGYNFPLSVGKLGVEALVWRWDMVRTDFHEYTATTLALAGRFNFALGYGFEVFGRLGIVHTNINPKLYQEPYSGNGMLIGPGVEYRIPLQAVSLSVYIDWTLFYLKVVNDDVGPGAQEMDVVSRVFTLGAAISF